LTTEPILQQLKNTVFVLQILKTGGLPSTPAPENKISPPPSQKC